MHGISRKFHLAFPLRAVKSSRENIYSTWGFPRKSHLKLENQAHKIFENVLNVIILAMQKDQPLGNHWDASYLKSLELNFVEWVVENELHSTRVKKNFHDGCARMHSLHGLFTRNHGELRIKLLIN